MTELQFIDITFFTTVILIMKELLRFPQQIRSRPASREFAAATARQAALWNATDMSQ
jgi:hypothetical protein